MIKQCFLTPTGFFQYMMSQNGLSIQNIINGPLGILFLLAVTKLLPPKAGYWLADRLGGMIARRNNLSIVQAVRVNQWVAAGCKPSAKELDQLTRAVFVNHGRCLYDFYRFVNDPSEINRLVTLDDKFRECIINSRSHNHPQILVTPHFSNYELAARAAALNGLTMQILSFPNPGRSYRWQNKFRNFKGIEVTPISISSLHKALKRLEGGGTILTGIDRPNGGEGFHPIFFGKPASLPTGIIRLAIKTGVPVSLILCSSTDDGRYNLSVSDPICMKQNEEAEVEEKQYAENILASVEDLINSDRSQWSMFYPIWPDVMKDLPI